MATNRIQGGRVLTLPAPSGGVVSGTGYLIGGLFGVALTTAAEGVDFDFDTSGVWSLPKTAAQAWTAGQKIYRNASDGKMDSDSTVGPLVGVATRIEANPTSTGRVRLNGAAASTAEGAQGAIVVLTDNTGGSGTHDDTLADGLTAVNPTAITNYTAVVNMTNPVTKTEGEAVSAALATLQDEVTLLAATVTTLVTDVTTQNQNDSDLAQKVIEIRAALIAAGILTA